MDNQNNKVDAKISKRVSIFATAYS